MRRVFVAGFAIPRPRRVAYVVVDSNDNTPVERDRIVLVRLHRTSNRRIHYPFGLDIVDHTGNQSLWIE